ncbi:hypothetical protein [Mycolicibacterium bacteremicum]|uniref:hypothetical protein n=1 Tax=Mycolicibacterium bacteremicum TaxID=564198 RepID=UPI0026ECC45D|nr:hypothetical protein [Mycolicibacterium bacteremicum]
MDLLPKVDISDNDVADVLARAVALSDLILDVLAGFDPLGLRRHLEFLEVPGTEAWEEKTRDERIGWWIWRVGALDTVAVAWPGALGALASRLPIQDLLGFASQTLILCAVAREYGVTDRRDTVRMLASVLCGREIPDPPLPDSDEPWPDNIVAKVWHLAGILNAIGGELGKRPHPRAVFRYVGMLPVVGAVAAYLGEYGALHRAAKAGQKWLTKASHPR